jgi:hypothetical protein
MRKRLFIFAVVAAMSSAVSADMLDTAKFRRVLNFTASGYDGSETLENFPALVRFSEESVTGFRYAELGGTTNEVYAALRFADASGRNLDYEIDIWDTNGLSAVWVSLPELSGRTTKFKAYWSAVQSYSLPAVHPTNVWTSAGYVGVWHFSHRGGSTASTAYYSDSTGRGSDIMSPDEGATWWLASPRVDASCNANGTPWYSNGARGNAINTGDWTFSQTGYSVEAWTLNAGYGDNNTYIFSSASREVNGAEKEWRPTNGMQLYRVNAYLMDGVGANSEVVVDRAWEGDATNDWHYLSAVWSPEGSSDRSILYEAGVGYENECRVLRRTSRNAIDFTGGDDRFRGGMGIIGAWDNGGSNVYCVDEPRVRRQLSSTDWIQANWDTQRNGTDFLTVGEVKRRTIGLSIRCR